MFNTKFKSKIENGKLIEFNPNDDLKTVLESITKIGEFAFEKYLITLTKQNKQIQLTIPSNIKEIGKYAFCVRKKDSTEIESCDVLASLQINNGVTEIGEFAFCNQKSLKSALISGSVKNIKKCAFLNCISLNAIVLFNGVETIGESAFEKCGIYYNSQLTKIKIPSSVIKIEANAFATCRFLTDVDNSSNAQIDKTAFCYCPNGPKIQNGENNEPCKE